MSIEHLRQLRNELERHHWRIITEEDGNDYDISALWVIARPDGSNQLHIEFEGINDMDALSIEKSYGCRIKEAPDIGAYFGRISKSWPKELSEFITKLEKFSI